jgi:hypothetical protein
MDIFQTYELFVYGVKHDIINFRILWKYAKNRNNQIQVVNCILINFYYYPNIFIAHDLYENTETILHA